MDMSDYQAQAALTERRQYEAGTAGDGLVALLGLAGEVGELISAYKKKLRDGDSHMRFKERAAEELGDVLWYLATTARKFDLDLTEVARRNLEKTRARWGAPGEDGPPLPPTPHLFDAECVEQERLPRLFVAEFRDVEKDGHRRIRVFVAGKQMGDPLSDNAHPGDGYRFHDVFHLACAAVLGWSPVTRRNLGCKRRNDPVVDEVEDGGRAIVTEEGISALVFAYASDHKHLAGVSSLDYELLKAIRIMTSRLEVSVCTTGEWEHAILLGYKVWRQVAENGGGKVEVDLDSRRLTYLGRE